MILQVFQGFIRAFPAIGKLLDTDMAAEGLIIAMKNKISAVEKGFQYSKIGLVLFLKLTRNLLLWLGKGTFIDEMIKIAQVEKIQNQGVDYPRLTKEKAVSMMPEIIIISGMVEESKKHGGRNSKIFLLLKMAGYIMCHLIFI